MFRINNRSINIETNGNPLVTREGVISRINNFRDVSISTIKNHLNIGQKIEIFKDETRIGEIIVKEIIPGQEASEDTINAILAEAKCKEIRHLNIDVYKEARNNIITQVICTATVLEEGLLKGKSCKIVFYPDGYKGYIQNIVDIIYYLNNFDPGSNKSEEEKNTYNFFEKQTGLKFESPKSSKTTSGVNNFIQPM